ncbi:hypothetical protein BJ138DRAFT_1119147 [Hygrophoropsis aurantiaca]|uniref:Uncharacterized protein n=1 Tax=Hygrophoropsis aurantiaca TaxID=72124 RepID=A0ACB7ZVM5_9AGAM|nr:hypothetical protein BJ138DRAFT_1119147 [Hygrophoropsis aurantiaca]
MDETPLLSQESSPLLESGTSLITKRVEAASGAKYSTHNKRARKAEPIAPVGTSYTPVGRPDIASLRKVPPPPSKVSPAPAPSAGASIPKSALPSAPRPMYGGSSSTAPARATTAAAARAPVGAWAEESTIVSAAPPPPPAVPSAPRPVVSSYQPPARAVAPPAAPPAAPAVPTKPAEDDRIAPVGTAYTPVSLPAPKKLTNRFAQFEAQSQAQTQQRTPAPATGGAKKLTWSERQALAKKQAEEEEMRSKSAPWQTPVSLGRTGAQPAPNGVVRIVVGGRRHGRSEVSTTAVAVSISISAWTSWGHSA